MVTLLEEIEPEYYKDFIFTDKHGSKCMYEEAKKAIYEHWRHHYSFGENFQKA